MSNSNKPDQKEFAHVRLPRIRVQTAEQSQEQRPDVAVTVDPSAALVTPEQARILREKFEQMRKRPKEKRGRLVRESAVLSNKTRHIVLISSPGQTPRHGVIGMMRSPLKDHPGWRVAYISITEADSPRAAKESMRFMGKRCSFLGPAGVIQQLPNKLRYLDERVLPADRLYLGFDWLGATDVPTYDAIVEGLNALCLRLDVRLQQLTTPQA